MCDWALSQWILPCVKSVGTFSIKTKPPSLPSRGPSRIWSYYKRFLQIFRPLISVMHFSLVFLKATYPESCWHNSDKLDYTAFCFHLKVTLLDCKALNRVRTSVHCIAFVLCATFRGSSFQLCWIVRRSNKHCWLLLQHSLHEPTGVTRPGLFREVQGRLARGFTWTN